jgi:hypothetical protein
MVSPIPTAAQQAAQKAAEGTMTTLPGGTVRFQQGAPAPPIPTQEEIKAPRVHVGRGVHRVTVRGGEVSSQELGQVGVSVNDPNEGLGEFLSTGRQRHTGQAIGSVEDIRPDTLFKVGGLEISAEQAVSAGYLSKGRDGRYFAPGTPAPNAASDSDGDQQKKEKDGDMDDGEGDAPAEVFTGEIGEAIGELIDTIGPESDAVVASVLGSVTEGRWDDASARLASKLGVETGEAQEYLSNMIEKGTDAVVEFINKHYDVPGYAVIAYAKNVLPLADQRNMAYNLAIGDRATYDRLIEKYRRFELVRTTKNEIDDGTR